MLFEHLSDICAASDKAIVLLIDEVDSATKNQIFLDFLAQLRAYYINRNVQPTFQSVILAGVHDVKNLSPWNTRVGNEESGCLHTFDECTWDHRAYTPYDIAADFNVDMSFAKDEIAEMLQEYEVDYKTGMNVNEIAGLIYDYTSGYPFLVSRLCKLMDEVVYGMTGFDTKDKAWSKDGLTEAVKLILAEKNTLFESLGEKLVSYPELNDILRCILFTGKTIAYNYYESSINIATMFGFVKGKCNVLVIANRIFETWLYNYFLSTSELQSKDIYTASLRDKSQFVVDGRLNMKRILERFVVHFNDLYGDKDETFIGKRAENIFSCI